MNTVAGYGNAMGMALLKAPSSGTASYVNPNSQTGWHHFINMSFMEQTGSNMWQTQIANSAGSTDLWVRSRSGGAISDSTAWAAPWTRILTGSNYTNVTDERYVKKSGDTMTGTLTGTLSGNASSATKLNSYFMESTFYVTNDTHILKLGYWNCTYKNDNLVLLISSSFWGNHHGSVDIISMYQDADTGGTVKVQCNIKRIRLNSSRVFYYVKDDTNLRLYLYVYVTGGNAYGSWRTSVIQSEGGSWVSEYAINQSLSTKTEITDQLSPVDHTHSVMTNSEIDALF